MSRRRFFATDARRGFTLIEIVVAVAILTLVTAAIAPLVYRHLEDSKMAAAQVEVKVIGEALQMFHADTGVWPIVINGTSYSRLATQGSGSCGNEGMAPGDGSVATSERWSSFGSVYNLTDILIYNQFNAAGAALFTPSNFPARKPGWHGPYMKEIHGDPWGHPYVCNITWGAYQPGQPGYRNDREHNILIVSAGPDGRYETPFGDEATVVHEEIGGDDIGFVVRLARP